MADFDVWDVVKVPFPYTNRPVQQYRPARVVARHDAADSPALVWALMITSASHRRWTGDVEISDRAKAGLPAAAIVRSAKIATIEARDVERIGVLAQSDRPVIRDRIAVLFAEMLRQ